MYKFLLLICLLMLSGCVMTRLQSFEEVNEAQRLVDQGTLLIREGELEAAKASFMVALEMASNAAAFDGLGCVYLLKGSFDLAEEYFWRAYEVDANYNNSLGNLAILYELRGDYKRAKELYLRSLGEDPINFRARNNYAAFLLDTGGKYGKKLGLAELLKAIMLAQHPTIKDNIMLMQQEGDVVYGGSKEKN
jgi:Flp pilus assembly protein TadD